MWPQATVDILAIQIAVQVFRRGRLLDTQCCAGRYVVCHVHIGFAVAEQAATHAEMISCAYGTRCDSHRHGRGEHRESGFVKNRNEVIWVRNCLKYTDYKQKRACRLNFYIIFRVLCAFDMAFEGVNLLRPNQRFDEGCEGACHGARILLPPRGPPRSRVYSPAPTRSK